jgi:hypothetical protein
MVSLLHDMSDEDLNSFAELQGDPANSAQIQLFIYACFLIFTRTGSMKFLERAIQQAGTWVAETADDHLDRARHSEILDMISARMWECRRASDVYLPSLLSGRSVTVPNTRTGTKPLEYSRHKGRS